MGEVLSQNEIDSLLQALSSGEIDADEIKETEKRLVKPYDFARPAKFSKEHLRTLEIIFEHYGRLLSTNLPGYLRSNVLAEVVNSEAATYSEFTNALSNPVLLGIVSMPPLQGNIIIELSANMGYAIVDRMLGGKGVILEKNREFTEIELSIVERVMNMAVNLLRNPWKNVVETEPRLERIETNSQFAQIISPSEMIAIVTINLKIGPVQGLINICLPYMVLEDVMNKLNTKFWFSNMQTKDESSHEEEIQERIANADLPIKAVLGNSRISVSDFMNLQTGDIIKINTKVEQELDVYVGNIRKFTALPGASGDAYAVRITSVIREEQ